MIALHSMSRPSEVHRTARIDTPYRVDAAPPGTPEYRSLLGLDIQGSTSTTNVERGRARAYMYEVMQEALRSAGIGDNHVDRFIDRGDGVIAPVRPVPQAPKTRLLDTVIPTLSLLLAQHNGGNPDGRQLRMRAVLHAGEVHFDERGCYGEAIDLSCRLLDHQELRNQLSRTDAPLVLVVSEDIYRSIVRQGYDGINDDEFDPVVHVQMAGVRHKGWVTVPDGDTVRRIRAVTELDSRR